MKNLALFAFTIFFSAALGYRFGSRAPGADTSAAAALLDVDRLEKPAESLQNAFGKIVEPARAPARLASSRSLSSILERLTALPPEQTSDRAGLLVSLASASHDPAQIRAQALIELNRGGGLGAGCLATYLGR